jgi:hypothetical protein
LNFADEPQTYTSQCPVISACISVTNTNTDVCSTCESLYGSYIRIKNSCGKKFAWLPYSIIWKCKSPLRRNSYSLQIPERVTFSSYLEFIRKYHKYGKTPSNVKVRLRTHCKHLAWRLAV